METITQFKTRPSIYTYLEKRLGMRSYKTGSFFFLLSQTIGASFRLYLVAGVLQVAFFSAIGFPFWLTVLTVIAMIWMYTFRAGIKTVVWTDLIQTLLMLLSVGMTIIMISRQFNLNFGALIQTIDEHRYSTVFDWNWRSDTNFFKQFLAGIGIVIVMNGLDQNMMQKNLTCKNQKDAKKNLYWFSVAFLISNILFLGLGVMLYFFAEQKGIPIPANTDDLYSILALDHFSVLVGLLFLLGVTAAAYSSADSALTALTTSFCIDFLNLNMTSPGSKKTRMGIHVGFSIVVYLVIVLFHSINNESVVTAVFTLAGYTYGPLLGLFSFGIITKKKVKDRFVPYICLLSPILTYLVNIYSEELLWGYKFGFELLLLNGIITFLGLSISSSGINRWDNGVQGQSYQ